MLFVRCVKTQTCPISRDGLPPGSFPGSGSSQQSQQTQPQQSQQQVQPISGFQQLANFGNFQFPTFNPIGQSSSSQQTSSQSSNSFGGNAVYSGGFQSGWSDSSYGGASNYDAYTAGGKSGGTALCKVIPNGGALSLFNGNSFPAFTGKQTLEYWVYRGPNSVPPLTLTLISNQQGDNCNTVDTGSLSQSESSNGWAKFQVPLSRFSTRSSGGGFLGCSNQGSPLNVVKIEWQNKNNFNALICLDAVQLY
ncbi:hypothetical protein V8C86DRAFT_920777 [Haematococcus lacustris]